MQEELLDKRNYDMTDKEIMKRLLAYAKPYAKNFVLTFVLMIATVGFALLEPYLIGVSIDTIDQPNMDMLRLIGLLAIFILAIIVGNLFNYAQTIILQVTGQSIIYNIRKDIFTHLEYHDINYLQSRPAGSLVTRVTNDTNTLNEMYTSVIVSVFKNVLMVLGILGAMFLLDWVLTLYILGVVPFIIFFSFMFRRFSRKAYRRVRSNLSRVNAFLAEHLSLSLIHI